MTATPSPTLPPASPPPDGADLLPAPPRGPGVKVPFAAPPRDTDKTRTVVTIVLSAAAAIVLCGGVLIGTVSVLVWSSHEMTSRAFSTADGFMSDILDGDYRHAYKSTCKQLRDDKSLAEFTGDWKDKGLTEYELGSKLGNADDGDLLVPARLTEGGQTEVIELTIKVEPQTMEMGVCGY